MLQGVNILQCLVLALVDELRYHDTVTQLIPLLNNSSFITVNSTPQAQTSK